MSRPIHPDFQLLLDHKDKSIIQLYTDLREFILNIYPDSIELLYHTHALSSVYCVSEKMSDGFCMVPIYTNHMNLGFNKGTLLSDPSGLLKGTGKLIRHITISESADYRNSKVEQLLRESIELALEDRNKAPKEVGKTISRIKKL